MLSYAELDERANQLAHHLISLGVRLEVPVGVMMDRSLDLFVALLGVLKAGGAYVPMDPSYPPDRLALMMEDSEVCRTCLHGSCFHHLNSMPTELCSPMREAAQPARCALMSALRGCSAVGVLLQAPVLLSQQKVHAKVAVPTQAHVLLVRPFS